MTRITRDQRAAGDGIKSPGVSYRQRQRSPRGCGRHDPARERKSDGSTSGRNHGQVQEQAEEEVNAEKAAVVIAELEGGKSLRKAAAAAGVGASTVLDWTEADPAFAEQYARARTRGYQMLADEILEISDDSSGDVIETDRGPVANPEFTARSRLRIDSRKWMLSKMLPKVYGDKTQHEVSGTFRVELSPAENNL